MQILNIAQIVVSILLIVLILLQKSEGGIYGSEGRLYRTLRGIEKKIFVLTVILTAVFVILAVANLLL